MNKNQSDNITALKKETEGLTLEEIRMRQMVNSMKIKIERQRLLSAVLPGSTPTDIAVTNNINRIESYMQYASMAVTAFRMTKKVVNFFKKSY